MECHRHPAAIRQPASQRGHGESRIRRLPRLVRLAKTMLDFAEADVWRWVATNHRNNFTSWDEDLARRTRASDAKKSPPTSVPSTASTRRATTPPERVDEFLLMSLGLIDPATAGTDQPVARVGADARLNSETAGGMMDRMSIMALKDQGDDGANHCAATLMRRIVRRRN